MHAMRHEARYGVLLAGAAALLLLTGCSGASDAEATDVALAFEDASGDPRMRCDLLAPGTRAVFESEAAARCAEAIGNVPLPGGEVTAVEVWGGDAQIRLGRETVFLTETDEGWRVTAAGCEPRGAAPYDCEVQGP